MLDLSCNMVADDAFAVLVAALLRPHPALQQLNLSTNLLTAAAVEGLQKLISCPGLPLEALDISLNKLGPEGGARVLAPLLRADCVSNLTELDISGTGLRKHGFALLIPVLSSCRRLQSLNLSKNTLDDAKVLDGIADALSSATCSLRTLNLSQVFTKWTPETAKSLAKILSSPSLEAFICSRSNITDKVIPAIAEALSSNRTLKRLDLSHNTIMNAGAKQLAEALKSNASSALHYLQLERNWIGDQGFEAILSLLVHQK